MVAQAFGVPISQDVSWILGIGGMLFIASDGDQNDLYTAQTSFADTTPSFLLNNPSNSGRLCIPAFASFTQAGTVAGGDISGHIEARPTAAYGSGGTAEKAISGGMGMVNAPTEACTLYSGATAASGYGIKVGGQYKVAPDVSPAEGVINVAEWNAPAGLFLWPGSSLQFYFYAASTAPTLDWTVQWYEVKLNGKRLLLPAA